MVVEDESFYAVNLRQVLVLLLLSLYVVLVFRSDVMDTAEVPLSTAMMATTRKTLQFSDTDTSSHCSENAYELELWRLKRLHPTSLAARIPALSDFNTEAPADTSTQPYENFVFQYFRVPSMHVL